MEGRKGRLKRRKENKWLSKQKTEKKTGNGKEVNDKTRKKQMKNQEGKKSMMLKRKKGRWCLKKRN